MRECISMSMGRDCSMTRDGCTTGGRDRAITGAQQARERLAHALGLSFDASQQRDVSRLDKFVEAPATNF